MKLSVVGDAGFFTLLNRSLIFQRTSQSGKAPEATSCLEESTKVLKTHGT
jgi:hypothetical protein